MKPELHQLQLEPSNLYRATGQQATTDCDEIPWRIDETIDGEMKSSILHIAG